MCVCMSVCEHTHSCLTLCGPMDHKPLSMEPSRQEYWSKLPFPSPGDLADPGVKPAYLASSALGGRFFSQLSHQGSPKDL